LPAIAEVVSSSATEMVAQSLVQNDPVGAQTASGLSLAPRRDSHKTDSVYKPRFGSFVRVTCGNEDLNIIAVVNNVITSSMDSIHRPSAFGLSKEQLRLEQPQIFALLRTDIYASIIGYIQSGRRFQHLPPHPPDVHDFVFAATVDEIVTITDDFDFLRLLEGTSNGLVDELMAACVREAYVARGKDQNFLLKAGQAFSQLFRSDYERLVSILKKIKPQ